MLFVKNLNYTITGEDLYDLFGRYGSIRQIRIGNEPKTKGTAFVVFDDVMDVRARFVRLWSGLISRVVCLGEERS
jgi:pre-mRNA branch site protein p14